MTNFQTLCIHTDHCPQVGLTADGRVQVRTTRYQDVVVTMDAGEWGVLLTSVGATHDPLGVTEGLARGRAVTGSAG